MLFDLSEALTECSVNIPPAASKNSGTKKCKSDSNQPGIDPDDVELASDFIIVSLHSHVSFPT